MLLENLKNVKVLQRDQLKRIISGTAPDCEEGFHHVVTEDGVICREMTVIDGSGGTLGGGDDPIDNCHVG
ncbi:hypothetical protein [Winogradskyella sp.]|uniref:hypothetical protein n=1 Tax=Winogradskyella sp. TaxID=1883156 RepID=UPI003BAA9D0B